MLELFGENSELLNHVDYFHKKASSYMFERVLNMRLTLVRSDQILAGVQIFFESCSEIRRNLFLQFDQVKKN